MSVLTGSKIFFKKSNFILIQFLLVMEMFFFLSLCCKEAR